MPDEIIEELWEIKDSIAREQGNDVRKLAACVQGSHPENCYVSPERSTIDCLTEAPGQHPVDAGRHIRGIAGPPPG